MIQQALLIYWLNKGFTPVIPIEVKFYPKRNYLRQIFACIIQEGSWLTFCFMQSNHLVQLLSACMHQSMLTFWIFRNGPVHKKSNIARTTSWRAYHIHADYLYCCWICWYQKSRLMLAFPMHCSKKAENKKKAFGENMHCDDFKARIYIRQYNSLSKTIFPAPLSSLLERSIIISIGSKWYCRC